MPTSKVNRTKKVKLEIGCLPGRGDELNIVETVVAQESPAQLNIERRRRGARGQTTLATLSSNPIPRIVALTRCGRFQDAAIIAHEVLAEDPTNIAVMEMLSKAQWQLGQLEEVVRTTRSLVNLNPYEPGYHALLGNALQCLGRYGEASRAYERALEVPGSKEALQELNSWQAGLVAEMLGTDPVFNAEYQSNPASACAARGFNFSDLEPQTDRWLIQPQLGDAFMTRPS